MFNRRAAATLVGSILLAVASVMPACAQQFTSVDQQFAAFHERLSGAADGLLGAPSHPVALPPAQQPVESVFSREKFNSGVARVQQLRPLLEPILREYGVPTDFAAVVLVESGGRATALSPKGALGLWQLMPETARRYGLTVSAAADERTDALKATRAAARYLGDLYAQFGDWKLAFAAYNAGEQAVQRAMVRSGSHDFARITTFLPNETQAYVPAIMAARPLFGAPGNSSAPVLRAARAAQVLYASARLDN